MLAVPICGMFQGFMDLIYLNQVRKMVDGIGFVVNFEIRYSRRRGIDGMKVNCLTIE